MEGPVSATILRRVEGGEFLPTAERDRFRRILETCVEGERQEEGPELILETDPVAFLGKACGLVLRGHSIVLGNPHWGDADREQVRSQCRELSAVGGSILVPTGGTSGSLRLAVHRWETFVRAADGLKDRLGGGPISSFCVLPMWHVSGWMQAVRAVVTGGQWIPSSWRQLRESGFQREALPAAETTLSLVPTQLEQVLKAGREGLSFLQDFRGIFLGGGPWRSKASQALCRETELPILLSYGMTETAAMVTLQSAEDFLSGHLTAGRPLPHAEVRIEDGEGDGTGRIAIRSTALFSGYAGRSFGLEGGWFLTSDRGRLVSGRLDVLGRIDRVILSGGENIDLEVVESALRRISGVVEALAFGVPDPLWGERLEAAVVLNPGTPAHSRAIAEGLERHLPPEFRPKGIRVVKEIPLNAAGKRDPRGFQGRMCDL